MTYIEHAKLIKLHMNYEAGECTYINCRKDFDFDLLLNVVVSSL